MANNRMWLVNPKTSQKVLLAKTIGDSWYVFHDDLARRLNELFNAKGTFDSEEWVVQYEDVRLPDESAVVLGEVALNERELLTVLDALHYHREEGMVTSLSPIETDALIERVRAEWVDVRRRANG